MKVIDFIEAQKRSADLKESHIVSMDDIILSIIKANRDDLDIFKKITEAIKKDIEGLKKQLNEREV